MPSDDSVDPIISNFLTSIDNHAHNLYLKKILYVSLIMTGIIASTGTAFFVINNTTSVELNDFQIDQNQCNYIGIIETSNVKLDYTSNESMLELIAYADSIVEDKDSAGLALQKYYNAMRMAPDNIDVWNGIAYAQTILCDNNAAIESYNKSLSLDENNVNALNGIAWIHAKQALSMTNNNDVKSIANLAIEEYEFVLGIYENNVNALNGIGLTYNILKQYDLAIGYLEQSLNENPDNVSTINVMADAYVGLGNIPKAISLYEESLVKKPMNLDALQKLLVIYTMLSDQDDEINYSDKINNIETRLLQTDKERSIILMEGGLRMQDEGQDANAQALFERALELDPNNEIIKNLLR